jgi:hypothetical protein
VTVRLPASAEQLSRLYSKGWKLYGMTYKRARSALCKNAWARSLFEITKGTFGISVRGSDAYLDADLSLWRRTKR